MSAGLGTFEEGENLSGATIAVYGLGKMGLPLASVMAEHGGAVRGVDIDESVVESVNAGETPVEEPGLSELVAKHGGDAIAATTDGAAAAAESDVMIVIVPTVLDNENEPELGPVLAAGEAISQGVSTGDLVILESTAPPGTTAGAFREAVEAGGLQAGEDFGLAHCPERTSAGRVIRDLTESYPKIVGGIDDSSTHAAASLYSVFNGPGVIEVSSATAAEAVKVFEGTYRDVNIALANELALACEEFELDAAEVFEAANTQPYCELHDPGIGVGGHCIPVYPHFVIDRVSETPLLETGRQINDDMPGHAVDLLETLLETEEKTLAESNVIVLGITYRPGVRETRYAPAVSLIERLNAEGAQVFAHDPLLDDGTISEFGAAPVSNPMAPTDLDGVVLATGHDAYRNLDLVALRDGMRTSVLVDGRGFFESSALRGFTHATIGNGTSPPR